MRLDPTAAAQYSAGGKECRPAVAMRAITGTLRGTNRQQQGMAHLPSRVITVNKLADLLINAEEILVIVGDLRRIDHDMAERVEAFARGTYERANAFMEELTT
jgi:hypothetical protein